MRIVINECRSTLRRRRRNAEVELTDTVPAPQQAVPDPALREALYRLDVKLRLPLVLHHMEGYKWEEIAKMTGSTVNDIMQVNQLQTEPDPEQVLLIPVK